MIEDTIDDILTDAQTMLNQCDMIENCIKNMRERADAGEWDFPISDYHTTKMRREIRAILRAKIELIK